MRYSIGLEDASSTRRCPHSLHVEADWHSHTMFRNLIIHKCVSSMHQEPAGSSKIIFAPAVSHNDPAFEYLRCAICGVLRFPSKSGKADDVLLHGTCIYEVATLTLFCPNMQSCAKSFKRIERMRYGCQGLGSKVTTPSILVFLRLPPCVSPAASSKTLLRSPDHCLRCTLEQRR